MTSEKSLKPFTFNDIRGKIIEGESPLNLDKTHNGKRTHTTVQMTREMTTSNGCQITLMFPTESCPGVRRRIAEAFIATLEKGTEQ